MQYQPHLGDKEEAGGPLAMTQASESQVVLGETRQALGVQHPQAKTSRI